MKILPRNVCWTFQRENVAASCSISKKCFEWHEKLKFGKEFSLNVIIDRIEIVKNRGERREGGIRPKLCRSKIIRTLSAVET